MRTQSWYKIFHHVEEIMIHNFLQCSEVLMFFNLIEQLKKVASLHISTML